MQIWVDADSCPVAIREIIFRAAVRTRLNLALVANQAIRIPASSHIRFIQVAPGFDIADQEIVRCMEPGDLVITSDIPLASEVIAKGGLVLSSRGERYTSDNIGGRLNMRDFMDTMRASGIHSGGPAALSRTDRMRFANQLDRILSNRKLT